MLGTIVDFAVSQGASRPIMIVASLRAGTHNHEQPAVRGKWEDHDTDWEGPRSSHWGPRGSSAPTRVALATAMLTESVRM